MAESYVQVTEGSGKKLHAFQRVIGSNTVEDEVVLLGEPYLATYSILAAGLSLATSNSHVVELMAGAFLKLYVRRVIVSQLANASTATATEFTLHRLTSAGTGGTAITPAPFDTSDAAAGATAMSLPSAAGTAGTSLIRRSAILRSALATTDAKPGTIFEWSAMPGTKPIVVPAGTSNGLALRVVTGVSTTTADVTIEFVEANF